MGRLNGVNHAATALLVRRRWPAVPLALALVCVQASDLLWFALVSASVERVDYSLPARSLADVHFVYMPFSHALVSAAILAAGVALVTYGVRRRRVVAVAAGAALLSHVVLDVAVHVPDIALSYWHQDVKFGSGLYGVPTVAFAVEVAYMAWCWRVARGSRRLLAWMVGLNLTALSLYVPAVPGPERWFGAMPDLLPVLVLVQMILASVVVFLHAPDAGPPRDAAAGSPRAAHG